MTTPRRSPRRSTKKKTRDSLAKSPPRYPLGPKPTPSSSWSQRKKTNPLRVLNNDICDSSDSDEDESLDCASKLSSVTSVIVAIGKENINDDESQSQDNSTERSNTDEESLAEGTNFENDSIISEDNPTNVPVMVNASAQVDESMLPTLLAIVKKEEGEEDTGGGEDDARQLTATTNDIGDIINTDSRDISEGYQLVNDAESIPEMTEASAQVDPSFWSDIVPVKVEDTSEDAIADNEDDKKECSIGVDGHLAEAPIAIEEAECPVVQDAAAVTEPVDEEEHRADDEGYIGDLAQLVELGDGIEEEDRPCLCKDITSDVNVLLVDDALPSSRHENNNNDCEVSSDQTSDSIRDLFENSMDSNCIDEASTFGASEANDQPDHGSLDETASVLEASRRGDNSEASSEVVDALRADLVRKDISIATLNDELEDAKYDRNMYLNQSNRFEILCKDVKEDLLVSNDKLDRSEAEKEVLAEENENLTKSVEDLTVNNNSLLEELFATKGELNSCQVELKDSNTKNVALEEELGTVRKEKNDLSEEVNELEGKVSTLAFNSNTLQDDLISSKAQVHVLESKLSDSEEKNASLEDEKTVLKAELVTARKENNDMAVTVNTVTSEMEEARHEIVTLKNQLNEKVVENACLKEVNSNLENEIEAFESEQDRLYGELASARDETKTVRNELNEANAQIGELQSEKSKIENEHHILHTNLVAVQKEKEDLLDNVQSLTTEKAHLEEKLDELEVCSVPPSVVLAESSGSICSKDSDDDLSYGYSDSLGSSSDEVVDELKKKLQHSEMEIENLTKSNELNMFLSGNPTTMRQLLEENNELTGALQKLEEENSELVVQNKHLQILEDPVDVKSLEEAIADCDEKLKLWKAMLASIGNR